jgi:hypothetical protein
MGASFIDELRRLSVPQGIALPGRPDASLASQPTR